MASGCWSFGSLSLIFITIFARLAGSQNCTAVGNLHFLTFDGRELDFYYPCKYTLVRTCSKFSPVAFDIALKTKKLNERGSVGIQYVEVRAEGQVLQLYPNGSAYVNGILTEAYNYKCKLKVQRVPAGAEVTIVGADVSVSIDEYGGVLVRVPTRLRTFLCGACGNFDGDPSNDRNASSSYAQWFMPDKSDGNCASLPKVDETTIAQRIQTCMPRFDLQQSRSCDWFHRSTTSAFLSCTAPYPRLAAAFRAFCLHDLCLSTSPDEVGSGSEETELTASSSAADVAVTCPLAAAFAAQCYARGRPPLGWRDAGCGKRCPRGSQYSQNTTSCPQACSMNSQCDRRDTCQQSNTEGCACPAGSVWSGSSCRSKGDCGCFYAGLYYQEGSTWLDDECSAEIRCRNGALDYSPVRCAPKSKCATIQGSAQCVCPDGYKGDGRNKCTYICGPGKHVNQGNDGCEDCSVGTYQPEQNSRQACIDCPDGTLTVTSGSVSSSECKFINMIPYSNVASACNTNNCIKRVYPPAGLLKTGVSFGRRRYREISVSSNGLITFGGDFVGITPESLTAPTTDYPKLAPLWFRQDYRTYPSSKMTVGEYSLRDSRTDTLQLIDNLLSAADRQADPSFRSIWALVVTWQNTAPLQLNKKKPQWGGKPENATFQAVVATDGMTTYAAYLYPRGRLHLSDPGCLKNAFMGYNSAEKRDGMAFGFYGSATPLMGQLDTLSSNTDIPGRWVFKVSSGKSSNQLKECLQWYSKEAATWTLSKPSSYKCPCDAAAAKADPGYTMNENTSCATSVFPNKLYNLYQRCCYELSPNGKGRLITEPQSAGGPVANNPLSPKKAVSYSSNDEKPFTDCCQDSNNCNLYRRFRPADDCSGYSAPKSGAGCGDPHFRTIDGLRYTYNGVGEFHLLRSSAISIQVRLGKMNGLRATEIAAVAMEARKPRSSRVHVEASADRTGIFAKINSPASGFEDTVELQSFKEASLSYERVVLFKKANGFRVSFENGYALDVGMNAGMMQYTVYAPQDEWGGNTSGLLGRYDGKKENDLMLPNGTLSSCSGSKTDSRCIFQNFGPAWRITREESIFWYRESLTTESYTDMKFVPFFLEDEPNLNQTLRFCKGNTLCAYDLLATRNQTVANATLQGYLNDERNMNLLARIRPVIKVSRSYLKAVVGAFSSFTVDVFPGSNNDVTLQLLTSPAGAVITAVSKYTYYFSWRPRDPSIASPIRFLALDSNNMTSASVTIKVVICPGCGSNGSCIWPVESDMDEFTSTTCNCSSGWSGTSCDKDFDACLERPCGNGTCIDLPPGEKQDYACLCPGGFLLINHEGAENCIDIDECLVPELNRCHQQCNNIQGSYECSCNDGFEPSEDGVSCKRNEFVSNVTRASTAQVPVAAACPPGRYGLSCSQNCDCGMRALKCDNLAGCTECAAGWRGEQCAEDVDECGAVGVCSHNNSLCVNTAGSYSCSCAEGYAKVSEVKCTDVDECSEMLGACAELFSACVNTPGSFKCTCLDGYQAVGSGCTDINECLIGSPCADDSECLNAAGGYSCRCRDGYRGDGLPLSQGGTGCVDVDECDERTDVCPANSACANTPGSFQCGCDSGSMAVGVCCVDSNIKWSYSGACTTVTVCCTENGQYRSFCTADFVETSSTDSCTTLLISVAPDSLTLATTHQLHILPNVTDRADQDDSDSDVTTLVTSTANGTTAVDSIFSERTSGARAKPHFTSAASSPTPPATRPVQVLQPQYSPKLDSNLKQTTKVAASSSNISTHKAKGRN